MLGQAPTRSFDGLVAATIFLFMMGTGSLAILLLDNHLTSHSLQSTSDTAALVATQIENELQTTAERARFAVATALRVEEGRSGVAPLFEGVTSLAGITIMQRASDPSDEQTENPEWTTLFHWPRPAGDPLHWSEKDFAALEHKFPVDLSRVQTGAMDLVFGLAPGEIPILRLATPFGQQALILELKAERIAALLRSVRGQFVFIASRELRLLASGTADHFTPGEDLSALPVLREAAAAGAPSGKLEYSEVPEGELYYASYVRSSLFTLVSQVPRSHVTSVLWACAWALVIASIAGSLFGGIAGGMRRSRVTDEDSEEHEPQGDLSMNQPPTKTALKMADEVPANGPPKETEAVILSATLRGLDQVSERIHPARAGANLKKLRQTIDALIRANGGTIRSWRDGNEWAFIASWPLEHDDSQSNGAASAVDTCVEIRGIIQDFNREIFGKKWFEFSETTGAQLVMGLNCGVVLIQGSRLSGAPLDLVARFEALARHMGTDLLISSSVAPHLPERITLESSISGDEDLPELFELVAIEDAQSSDSSLDEPSFLAA